MNPGEDTPNPMPTSGGPAGAPPTPPEAARLTLAPAPARPLIPNDRSAPGTPPTSEERPPQSLAPRIHTAFPGSTTLKPAAGARRSSTAWCPGVRRTPSGAFDLGDAGFYGLLLAAPLADGYRLSRLRHNQQHHPTNIPFADSATGALLTEAVDRHKAATGHPDQPTAELRDRTVWTPLHITPRGFPAGERLDNTLPIDPTTTRGLGLVGPGAADALRALTMSLASYHPDTYTSTGQLLITHDAAHALLGTEPPTPMPPGLHIVKNLEKALPKLERLIQERDTHRDAADQQPLVALVLAQQPTGHSATHLASLLKRGAPLGVTALLLGAWTPATLAIHNQIVTSTHGNPNLAYLTGTRLFNIPQNRAIELWSLLAHDQILETNPPHTDQTPPTESPSGPG